MMNETTVMIIDKAEDKKDKEHSRVGFKATPIAYSISISMNQSTPPKSIFQLSYLETLSKPTPIAGKFS